MKYNRYLICGWFDLMGIENGVNYMRFNRASCTIQGNSVTNKS